jgi:isopenicillin-N epimerase
MKAAAQLNSVRDGLAGAWGFARGLTMLNHGSFGACPRPVLRRQAALRRQMEARPVRFLVQQMQPLVDRSRRALAETVGAEPENLVFVTNATAGVNAVLRSLRFQPGDELLLTNHGYNACNNVVRYVAQRQGATVAVAEIPIPFQSPEEITAALLAAATPRTRLVIVDHITSPTAAVFPIAEIVRQLDQRGVDCLVDGAHGPGMVPLDLKRLGAAYYTGNCHKWLCAPKGAGFLYVRPDRQEAIQPPVISHGYNQPRPGYSRMQDAFDWQGTFDPSPWLCVDRAISFLSGLVPGGLDGLIERNHQLAVAAQRMLCGRLPLRPVCAEGLLGSMAAFLLPDGAPGTAIADRGATVPLPQLNNRLADDFAIEVPVYYFPAPPQTVIRISAQAYNSMEQYQRLADVLEGILAGK